MCELTELLKQNRRGAATAEADLWPLVYHELRRLAAARMAQESSGHTFQATALVHEAYLRLVHQGDSGQWANAAHFYAAAAEAMRRILVDAARRKGRLKRGGSRQRREFEEFDIAAPLQSDEVLAIHDALGRLEEANPTTAELVKLRYFAGFSNREAAEILGVSARKATQLWTYAKTWLLAEMEAR